MLDEHFKLKYSKVVIGSYLTIQRLPLGTHSHMTVDIYALYTWKTGVVVVIHSLELFNGHRCFFFLFFVCIRASNMCLVIVSEGGILLF